MLFNNLKLIRRPKDLTLILILVALQSSLSALEEKNSALEHELIKGKEESTDTIAKLRAVEETCSQLQQNLKR